MQARRGRDLRSSTPAPNRESVRAILQLIDVLRFINEESIASVLDQPSEELVQYISPQGLADTFLTSGPKSTSRTHRHPISAAEA
jgi:hypothetical protein